MSKRGKVLAQKIDDFCLYSADGQSFDLGQLLASGPCLLAFFPGGPVKPVCWSQFCDYRDNYDQFKKFNIKIIGISTDSLEKQREFAQKNEYPFLFLTDPNNIVAKKLKATSFFMLGGVSRAVYVINPQKILLYQYVEPTWLTRRKSPELLGVLKDLQDLGVLNKID